MSRPKPTVILQDLNYDTNKGYWVCEADAIYAVCYRGRPILVKFQNDISNNYPGPKYVKTSFPSAGHAFNLADRLNERFNTEDFTVSIMAVGRTIREK
jgi:hypothetical protein